MEWLKKQIKNIFGEKATDTAVYDASAGQHVTTSYPTTQPVRAEEPVWERASREYAKATARNDKLQGGLYFRASNDRGEYFLREHIGEIFDETLYDGEGRQYWQKTTADREDVERIARRFEELLRKNGLALCDVDCSVMYNRTHADGSGSIGFAPDITNIAQRIGDAFIEKRARPVYGKKIPDNMSPRQYFELLTTVDNGEEQVRATLERCLEYLVSDPSSARFHRYMDTGGHHLGDYALEAASALDPNSELCRRADLIFWRIGMKGEYNPSLFLMNSLRDMGTLNYDTGEIGTREGSIYINSMTFREGMSNPDPLVSRPAILLMDQRTADWKTIGILSLDEMAEQMHAYRTKDGKLEEIDVDNLRAAIVKKISTDPTYPAPQKTDSNILKSLYPEKYR